MEKITTETNEMINLIRRYQLGDIAVREKLVEKNVDLVQALARKSGNISPSSQSVVLTTKKGIRLLQT